METFYQVIFFFYLAPVAYAEEVKVSGYVDSVFKIIEGISTSDGISLWVKAGLMAMLFLGGIGGSIYLKIYRAKIRKEKAEKQKERDIIKDVKKNDGENDQAENDARSLRDQIEGKDGDI